MSDRPTAAELAKALRCSATVISERESCEGCRYLVMEQVREDIPVKPDTVVYGIGYWRSCDVDRMAIEAAEFIERMEQKRKLSKKEK